MWTVEYLSYPHPGDGGPPFEPYWSRSHAMDEAPYGYWRYEECLARATRAIQDATKERTYIIRLRHTITGAYFVLRN